MGSAAPADGDGSCSEPPSKARLFMCLITRNKLTGSILEISYRINNLFNSISLSQSSVSFFPCPLLYAPKALPLRARLLGHPPRRAFSRETALQEDPPGRRRGATSEWPCWHPETSRQCLASRTTRRPPPQPDRNTASL